jgi:hypothetical protein
MRWRLNRFYRFCGLDLGKGSIFWGGGAVEESIIIYIYFFFWWVEGSYRGIIYQNEMLLFSTKTYSLNNLFGYRFERFGF